MHGTPLSPAWIMGQEQSVKGTSIKTSETAGECSAGGSSPLVHLCQEDWDHAVAKCWRTPPGLLRGSGRGRREGGISGVTFCRLALPDQEGSPGVFRVEQQPLGLPTSDLPKVPPVGTSSRLTITEQSSAQHPHSKSLPKHGWLEVTQLPCFCRCGQLCDFCFPYAMVTLCHRGPNLQMQSLQFPCAWRRGHTTTQTHRAPCASRRGRKTLSGFRNKTKWKK